jgi:CheY-like chemotaxis protein
MPLPPPIAVDAGLRQPRTALVVEDDDRTADLVRVLLETEGFVVIRARNAEQALVLAGEHELSLITVDVLLPDIKGWELLSTIRADVTLAAVPVVIIAGAIDNNLALTGGAAAVLEKPISRGELKETLADLGLHATHDHTRTILVVDDDPKAVELIAAFLPTPAYAIVRAYGGTEAIILAQRLRPDLILLDLMMPDVNGFNVVTALQRDPGTSSIPIVVVTAKHISADDRAALCDESGALIRIVEKGDFDGDAFVSEVRRALRTEVEARTWLGS